MVSWSAGQLGGQLGVVSLPAAEGEATTPTRHGAGWLRGREWLPEADGTAEAARQSGRGRLVDAHDMKVVQVHYDYAVGSHKPELMGWLVFFPSLETPMSPEPGIRRDRFFKEHGRSDGSREHGSHHHGSRLAAGCGAAVDGGCWLWMGGCGEGESLSSVSCRWSESRVEKKKKTRQWFWHV